MVQQVPARECGAFHHRTVEMSFQIGVSAEPSRDIVIAVIEKRWISVVKCIMGQWMMAMLNRICVILYEIIISKRISHLCQFNSS